MSLDYILITSAKNEESYIERTIESVISQTILPLKWVIVDDGSSDDTANIVRRYSMENKWICLVQKGQGSERSFASKAKSFNYAYSLVKHLDFQLTANIDADISFESDFFEFLIMKFERDPELGVAGTPYQEGSQNISNRKHYDQNYVHGQCQMFRRDCIERIGGYKEHKYGGVDLIAVVSAKMFGWKVRSFTEKAFIHHRPMGTADNSKIRAIYKNGVKDFYLGSHPLWELVRVFYQMTRRPYILGGLVLTFGYLASFICGEERLLPREIISYRRSEQIKRLKSIFLKQLSIAD